MGYLSDADYKAIGQSIAGVSFLGIAKVDEDFTILWTNEQFLEILGVMAGDILDVKYTDITPEPYKTREKVQSALVVSGRIKEFMLPKDFQMQDGRVIKTQTLTRGVRCEETNDFLFFISQLMPREERLDAVTLNQSDSTWMTSWIDKKKVVLSIITTFLGLLIFMIERKYK